MKGKIKTIILIIVFVCILLIVNNFVNSRNEELINEEFASSGEERKMEVRSITGDVFEEEVLKSDKKVLIDFYADWCGPCKMLSPIVEQVASEHDEIKVVKVNIDVNQALAMKYGISSIPTLVVVENGETKNVSVGLISKSEVEELIK